MFDSLFAWPDELSLESSPDLVSRLACLIRLQHFAEAERGLLLAFARESAQKVEIIRLLVVLRLCQLQVDAAVSLLDLLPDCSAPETIFLRIQVALDRNDQVSLLNFISISPDPLCLPLAVAHVAANLALGRIIVAEAMLEEAPQPHCLELVRLRARILATQHQFEVAADLLMKAADRFPQHRALQAELVAMLIKARSRNHTLPRLDRALALHGELAEYLDSISQIHMLKRQPAMARRCSLRLQAHSSIQPRHVDPIGLIAAYEQTGYVDWLAYLHSDLLGHPVETSAVQQSLCLYLASMQSPAGAAYVTRHVQRLVDLPQFKVFASSGLSSPRAIPRDAVTPLSIAWITGDLAHHPVSRFLLGFFRSVSSGLKHKHLLVDVKDHLSESVADWFEGIEGLECLRIGALSPNAKLAAIRDRSPHIAVDLSGWTDGNFATAFMARMASIQINYLGYFASTGIPAMDSWLGDHQLFPTPMQEWHSESIIRLKRCFIAWQPPEILVEARVQIADGPRGLGIRFGSFNHNRKLSDATLRLWGRILKQVPDSSLVLKANRQGDEATQILLRRRMLRQGLDPERVIWLPIAPTPEDHLNQYGQVDIALDCFPNGGCTTTCEALWMGVPVITLTGSAYVSRMSTAVLHGAGLPQLCAHSEDHYLQLALELAAQRSWLRQHRDHWRVQLQSNPLGDAADLMHHLEDCFSMLYRNSVNRSSTSLSM